MSGTPRHVLVTGAASGIGAAAARRFAADGARLTLVDLQRDRLADLAPRLAAQCASVSVLAGDLTDESFAGRVVADAWNASGPIDVAVLAAGIYPAIGFLELTPAAWDQVQHVNVRAVMQITQAVARHAIASSRRAVIVHVSSGAAQRARRGAAHYSASKAALEMLTRSAAIELGQFGIRVNAVSPGFIGVDSDVNPVSPEYTAMMAANPLGRPGHPDDVAAAIHWLSSAEAEWITGSVLRVDGGASAGNMSLPLHWSGSVATEPTTVAGEPGNE
ncbi:MAG: SDR family NAD(P)-dependent oxidoreductase [Gemmatimonadaceae bacterium]